MKKNLKKVFIVILLLSLLIPLTYSYALSLAEPDVIQKQFFEISKKEVTKNEKVEMTINLDVIKYNEFTFTLTSDEVIENLEITQSEEITAQQNNNEIVMEINKEETNVQTINLYYSIPENKKVGDTIKFIATITSNIENGIDETDKEIIEVPAENEEITKNEIEVSPQSEETNVVIDDTEKVENNNNVIDEQKQDTQTIEIEIKIVEEKSDNQQTTGNNQIPNQNNGSSGAMPNISINNSNMPSGSMGTQVQKVVYKGSDNNYLSKLSAKGYTFNREFSKENSTYFITVENDIKKVNITAIAQDDDAKVCVYGNDNLKEGTNKILITVTAENGNVRNYRIYVTKNN